MRLPEQLVRILIVTALLVVLAGLTRFVFVPSSFFSSRLHRESTTQREMNKPLRFAGAAACAECHTDIVETKSHGYHQGLGCETCHDAAAAHVEDPFEVKPYAPRDRKFCPICHDYNSARPTGFPQINPTAHNPLRACITCHDPHDPVPPEVPRECSACHAQIARTKAISSHALLECTTCHAVTKEHRIAPRTALPSKPQERGFCGQCHARGADRLNAPKIDMDDHGGTFLCWDCHYPHLPEGSS